MRLRTFLGGAAPLLSAGILLLTPSTNSVIAAQSTAARQAMRLPDATKFPSWERPLTFSKTYYVDATEGRLVLDGRTQPVKSVSSSCSAQRSITARVYITARNSRSSPSI